MKGFLAALVGSMIIATILFYFNLDEFLSGWFSGCTFIWLREELRILDER